MRAHFVLLAIVATAPFARADEPESLADPTAARRFTFSWPFADDAAMKPRGGTTRGAPVTRATAPGAEWLALRAPDLDAFERDRRAILAMAGSYRTTFDFIETVGFTAGYSPPPPYQSWSTEHVRIIEDRGDFISLQHLLVMFFADGDGGVTGPVVTKHWRQDWQYEDRDLHEYAGRNRWERRDVGAGEVRGKWSQAVFQVDDSPRYEALGEWVHDENYSAWTAETTWRPLPRREHSVRDDYDVLEVVNRHTILPTGWVHEEDNLKVVLGETGMPADGTRYLARELGLNRYERLADFDASAAERYWSSTAAFWSVARNAWTEVYATHDTFEMVDEVDGEPLFARMLEFAAAIDSSGLYDDARARTFVRETLGRYVR